MPTVGDIFTNCLNYSLRLRVTGVERGLVHTEIIGTNNRSFPLGETLTLKVSDLYFRFNCDKDQWGHLLDDPLEQ
jgi:hypothetical protein